MKSVSVKLANDKASNDRVSVKVRLSYNREQRKYALPGIEPVIITPELYSKLVKFHESQNHRVSEEIRKLYSKVKPHLKRAEELSASIQPFDFDTFKKKFATLTPEQSDVANLNVHDNLTLLKLANHSEGRINNGDLFEAVSQSLIRFRNGSRDLSFLDITPEFLNKYEKWMLTIGKAPKSLTGTPGPASPTTVGIYLRQLRTAFNEAIRKKLISEEAYPFKKQYTIPAGESSPKALTKEHIFKIFDYIAEPGSMRERSRDLWVFTYLCNGINMKDICNLRWSDVDLTANEITFKRQKTIRSRKGNMKEIRVVLFPEVLDIIKKWGTRISAKGYVFSFLKDDMTEKRKREVIDQVISVTNNNMRKIAKELDIPIEVKTYEARHSFATILMQSGNVPFKFISDALGHTSLKTTQAYLGRFSDNKARTFLSELTRRDETDNP